MLLSHLMKFGQAAMILYTAEKVMRSVENYIIRCDFLSRKLLTAPFVDNPE